ncbi:RNA polymerase sigma factor [Paenibacillus sp. GYB003]|uniref:RNA polymerase sigma factor n=1 Tax=Paenibacillus sp. GYB003 TaxID=2994392 RepID=UPI002F965C59
MLQQNGFDESMIRRYSKRIFGFALAKTGHRQNAEDLAQEIAIALLRSVRSGKRIDNWDSWVYTLCFYTWSNYVNKEKRHWRHADIDDVPWVASGEPPQSRIGEEDGLERLAMEVACLSKRHRDIAIRYYYDRESVDRIAASLAIAPGTVKWHLFEARKKLREGLNMNAEAKSLSFKPVRLGVGHNGTPGPNGEPNCYFQSLVVSNIFAAAYDKPLTVEEIARTIGVGAAYVEDEIDKCEKSDLLRRTGNGKYQTNFIIETLADKAEESALLRAGAETIAKPIYDAVSSRLDDIRALGFRGSDANDAFLLWAFVPYAVYRHYGSVKDADYYKRYQPPERKDGGKYIVAARIIEEPSEYERVIPDYDIVRKYVANGIKSRSSGPYSSLQMETWWSGLQWRYFDAPQLSEMARIVELIESGEAHGEYDKLLISRMVEAGYASNEGGRLKSLVPFFTKEQFREFNAIVDEAFAAIEAKPVLENVHDQFVRLWKKLAPAHIAETEIVNKAMNSGGMIIFAIMEVLERRGLLPLPAEEEKKRLTTILWSRK